MPGRGRNEVISIKISVPFANAIEGALCVDAISTRSIFLPETSLCCTRAPHFLRPSVLPDLPEAHVSGAECCAVSFSRLGFPPPSYNLCMYSFVFMELLIMQGMMGCFFSLLVFFFFFPEEEDASFTISGNTPLTPLEL